jgi:hypothetical protein
MKFHNMNSVPMQYRPIIDGAVVAFDERVVPPTRSAGRPAGTLHLPKLALVISERDG